MESKKPTQEDKTMTNQNPTTTTYTVELDLSEIMTVVSTLRSVALESNDNDLTHELETLANQIKAVVTKKTELTARIDKLEDEIVALGAAKS